jgi:hypothetical protein
MINREDTPDIKDSDTGACMCYNPRTKWVQILAELDDDNNLVLSEDLVKAIKVALGYAEIAADPDLPKSIDRPSLKYEDIYRDIEVEVSRKIGKCGDDLFSYKNWGRLILNYVDNKFYSDRIGDSTTQYQFESKLIGIMSECIIAIETTRDKHRKLVEDMDARQQRTCSQSMCEGVSMSRRGANNIRVGSNDLEREFMDLMGNRDN